MDMVDLVHLSHRPVDHTELGWSPMPHSGQEPGRSVTAAGVLAPHGPKAPQWKGYGLECAVCGVSAVRLGRVQGWLAPLVLTAPTAVKDSAQGTSQERCLLGLRHSPQRSATTCRGEKQETEPRAKEGNRAKRVVMQ